MIGTMRRNGVTMIDLTIRQQVSHDDLVLAVEARLSVGLAHPRTRERAMEMVRFDILHPDDFRPGADRSSGCRDAAEQCVSRLFPEMTV